MPSPVGHALGGVIVGLVADRRLLVDAAPRRLWLLALAAAAPDLDFLWGRHGAETHSLGAAVLAGIIVWLATGRREARLSLCVSLAWSTHVLFDWLGSDDTPPLGVMALWPAKSAYYFAEAFVFDAISRRYWLPGFWTHNLLAVAREVVLLGPIAIGAWWWRGRDRRRA